MNKKQGIIIMGLLALIICAGVLATKMNDNTYTYLDDSTNGTTSVTTTQKTNEDYFTQSRLLKTTDRNNALTSFKQMADDKNLSTDSRNAASSKVMKYAENALVESKIETELKGKGYQDIICWLDENPIQVRITVKSKDKLTDQQSRGIVDVATTLAHIKTVKIDVKQ